MKKKIMAGIIDFHIGYNPQWSRTSERGHIKDVTIDGLKVLSGNFCTSRIQGFDENHMVSDVHISNLEILGEKITDFEAGRISVNPTSTANITIE